MAGGESTLDDFERERLTHDFRVVVETAIQGDNERIIQVNGRNLVFSGQDGRKNHHDWRGMSQPPSHTLSTGDVSFGLMPDGSIWRNYSVGTIMPSRQKMSFGANLKLELNPRQVQATIDYFTSPHLRGDELSVAIGLTPEEEQIIVENRKRDAKANAEFRRIYDEGERAQARARTRRLRRYKKWLRPLGGLASR